MASEIDVRVTGVNTLTISGTLVEKQELRYTPAGIAVFEGVLHHESSVYEAGANRQVQFDCPVIAFADAALRLNAVAVGSSLQIKGFVSPRSVRSSRLTVHVTEFKN